MPLQRAIASNSSPIITKIPIRHGSSTKKLGEKRMGNIKGPWNTNNVPEKEDDIDINELAASIDTTIPADKIAHVEKLKKMISGGHLSERSLYREVPTLDEIDQIHSEIKGNFIPNVAPNARELIDFALSHIPERDGPRRSKHKKRMAQKWANKEKADAIRKKQCQIAHEKKHKKLNYHRGLVKKYLKQAKQINEAKAAASSSTTANTATASS